MLFIEYNKSIYTTNNSLTMDTETEDVKSKFIIIKVSPTEKELLKSRAVSFHLSLSRYLVMMGARGKVE